MNHYDQSGKFLGRFIGETPLTDNPQSMALGPDGNLYVCCNYNSYGVKRYNAATGEFIDTFIPGINAADLEFTTIDGQAVAIVTGRIPLGHSFIRKYDAAIGAFLGEIADLSHDGMDSPAITVGPDGLLYAADINGHRVVRYDLKTGKFQDTFVTSGINIPSDLLFLPDPPAQTCPADIVNTGGSADRVDVSDLLFLINAWGECP